MNERKVINWKEIVNKFSSSKGIIADFCKENNISVKQLYYYRRKFRNTEKVEFHAISLKSQTKTKSIETINTEIRIEIGKAKIYIPANEIAILTNILKELNTNV